MPSSLQALRIRNAISPRLAIRIFRNILRSEAVRQPALLLLRLVRMPKSGSPYSTGLPFSTKICTTSPATSDSISFINFIASMMRGPALVHFRAHLGRRDPLRDSVPRKMCRRSEISRREVSGRPHAGARSATQMRCEGAERRRGVVRWRDVQRQRMAGSRSPLRRRLLQADMKFLGLVLEFLEPCFAMKSSRRPTSFKSTPRTCTSGAVLFRLFWPFRVRKVPLERS